MKLPSWTRTKIGPRSTPFLTLALVGLVVSCDQAAPPKATPKTPPSVAPKVDAPFTDEQQVKDLLLTQASAWNHGDLPGFCSAYAEDALFLSPSGVTRGRAEILARYQKRYGNAPETMGSLTLEVLEVRGQGTAASVAMRWRLLWDPAQKKEPASGLSLVTLYKAQDDSGKLTWRIHQDASM